MIFASHPAGSAFVDFLLPDGNDLFYPVHHLMAGIEGLLTVGRCYGDDQADVTDIRFIDIGDTPPSLKSEGLSMMLQVMWWVKRILYWSMNSPLRRTSGVTGTSYLI